MLENIQRLRERTSVPTLILDESNIRYYTGIAQSGALLIDKEETLVAHDVELAQNSSVHYIVKPKDRTSSELINLLKKKKIKKIGVAFDSLSYPWFKKLSSGKIKLVDVSKTLSGMRAVKSDQEIEKIAKACGLADRAMLEIANNLSAGMSERQIRQYALSVLPQAEDVAFSFIIASGPNSEYTHVSPSERRIALTDFVIVDIGFRVDGYNSDMTRTFCLSPSKEQKDFYDLILKAQQLAMDKVSVGTSCGSVYGVVEKLFKKDDLARYWKYSLGHGVGLDIHEAPNLSKGSSDKFKDNMVFTIEPGIHIPEFGGVRIEDTFLLDKNVRPLTKSEHRLEP